MTNIISTGTWSRYTPNPIPAHLTGVIFYKNTANDDWYTVFAHNQQVARKPTVGIDANRIIRRVAASPDRMDPEGFDVYILTARTETTDAELSPLLGRLLNTSTGAVTDAPARVPREISRFQAKAALHAAGKLAQVEAAVAAANIITKLAWQDAVVFQRDSPTIATMAAAIGLSSSEVDALFIAAAQISA